MGDLTPMSDPDVLTLRICAMGDLTPMSLTPMS
jgi:hypothetical protein